jgi:peptidoglycan/xylan/chitin deacetylase (PgdA/CDA1 family)
MFLLARWLMPVPRLALPVLLAAFVVVPAASAQKIAVTFDDLPAHGDLPGTETRLDVANSILATLHAMHMPPTYGFVNGQKVANFPAEMAVLKAWRAAGNPLANHAWSHMNLNEHTAEEFEADIARNEPLLESLMGNQDWHWFRYPYLREGDTLKKRRAVRAYLFAHGYKIAQVNMNFDDYLWNDPYARCVSKQDEKSIGYLRKSYLAAASQDAALFRQLSHRVYRRDIPYVLLMHIGPFDAKMLPELLAMYRAKGFRFVSLPEAEKDPAYAADPDVPVTSEAPLLEQMMAARKLKLPPDSKPTKKLEALCR